MFQELGPTTLRQNITALDVCRNNYVQ